MDPPVSEVLMPTWPACVCGLMWDICAWAWNFCSVTIDLGAMTLTLGFMWSYSEEAIHDVARADLVGFLVVFHLLFS